jgi:hypothetical protein
VIARRSLALTQGYRRSGDGVVKSSAGRVMVDVESSEICSQLTLLWAKLP